KSQSTQPIVSTRPADMTFEDEKISDSDQITSSQKDVNPIQETPWIVSNEKKRTNFYPPSMGVRYSPATMHHYPPYTLVPPIHHHLPAPSSHIVHAPHIPTNVLYSKEFVFFLFIFDRKIKFIDEILTDLFFK
ncbi:unnamed protein product, partial [Rotaria sp. Silwood1]